MNRGWLPWKGKMFRAGDQARGGGGNRFEVGPLNQGVWAFETVVGPSRFGGAPACHVDYDLEGNAIWLRRTVWDEMKEMRPGLYLGKGGITVLGKQCFVFYWAVARKKGAVQARVAQRGARDPREPELAASL